MFQIVCALVQEVPAAAECLMDLYGVLPDVPLAVKPLGHVGHSGIKCGCRSSDQMAILAIMIRSNRLIKGIKL